MGYLMSAAGMPRFPVLGEVSRVLTDGDQTFGGDSNLGVDGNAATFAYVVSQLAMGEHAIYKLDLGAMYLISQIRAKTGMWANNNFGTAVGFTVACDISEDDIAWTEIDTFNDVNTLKNSVNVEKQDTFEMGADVYIARYIRIDFGPITATGGVDNEARVYELYFAGVPLREEPEI